MKQIIVRVMIDGLHLFIIVLMLSGGLILWAAHT